MAPPQVLNEAIKVQRLEDFAPDIGELMSEIVAIAETHGSIGPGRNFLLALTRVNGALLVIRVETPSWQYTKSHIQPKAPLPHDFDEIINRITDEMEGQTQVGHEGDFAFVIHRRDGVFAQLEVAFTS